MYLAMDDIGSDKVEKINKYSNPKDKWRKIDEIALVYGFWGIQISGMYKKKFGLDLYNIPYFICDYRLTYHIGGLYYLLSEDDVINCNDMIEQSLNIAESYGMEDVSFHPPFIYENIDKRHLSKDYLKKIITKWLPKYKNHGISLSLETHVSPEYFIFKNLDDFAEFASSYPDLGVLIDVSHNFYDGYKENNIIEILGNLKITGLHLSDSLVGVEFEKGTHLPVGKGNIKFQKILQHFKDKDIYGALEIRGNSRDILSSYFNLNKYII